MRCTTTTALSSMRPRVALTEPDRRRLLKVLEEMDSITLQVGPLLVKFGHLREEARRLMEMEVADDSEQH